MTDAESTPITGIGELTTNDGDDGTYAVLNGAALVISGNRVAWTGPASPVPAADRSGRTDGPTPLDRVERHIHLIASTSTTGLLVIMRCRRIPS